MYHTSLAEDEVVRAEELTEGTSANGVHGTRLQIHQDSAGHVATASGLVVVHVDPLQLEVGVAMVGTGRVDTVLVGADLPELGADLVTALAGLDGTISRIVKVVLIDCEQQSQMFANAGLRIRVGGRLLLYV